MPGRIVGFALKQWFDFSSTAYVRHAGILQERVWVDPKSGAKLAIQHRLDQIHSPEFELGGTFTHPDVLKPYELSFYRNPAFVKLRDAEIALTEEYIALSKSGQDIYAEIMLEFRRKRLAQVFNEQRSDPTETCSAQLRTSKN